MGFAKDIRVMDDPKKQQQSRSPGECRPIGSRNELPVRQKISRFSTAYNKALRHIACDLSERGRELVNDADFGVDLPHNRWRSSVVFEGKSNLNNIPSARNGIWLSRVLKFGGQENISAFNIWERPCGGFCGISGNTSYTPQSDSRTSENNRKKSNDTVGVKLDVIPNTSLADDEEIGDLLWKGALGSIFVTFLYAILKSSRC